MLMIDPPDGEAFGFPKPFDGQESHINEWLLANGYPQEWIDRFPDRQVPCRIIDVDGPETNSDWPAPTVQTRVTSRFLLLRMRARLLRVVSADVERAIAELECRDQLSDSDRAWLALLREPVSVLFDGALQESQQGETLRRAAPRSLALELPAHRSDDRLMDMARWQIESDMPPGVGDGRTFDPMERQREKAIARERDEHDLATGKVTVAQLRERNAFLGGFDTTNAEIILPDNGDVPTA